MKKSKSSGRWLKEHFDDVYVKKAQAEGYRSRAVYKLLEIQEKDKILKPGMAVVDLGAAPGGWMQIAKKYLGSKGTIIGLDLLEIEPIDGTIFIQGDFTSDEVYQQLTDMLAGRQVDVVMSDMAPNMSGIRVADQAKSIYLVELALDFAKTHLVEGGTFLAKVFQGEGFEDLLKDCKTHFKTVKMRKPDASRDRSSEMYLLAQGKLPIN